MLLGTIMAHTMTLAIEFYISLREFIWLFSIHIHMYNMYNVHVLDNIIITSHVFIILQD